MAYGRTPNEQKDEEGFTEIKLRRSLNRIGKAVELYELEGNTIKLPD